MQTAFVHLGITALLILVLAAPLPTRADKKHDHSNHGQHGTHKHDQWEVPPDGYAGMRSERWTDPAAMGRGQTIFKTHCVVCHGEDGKGTGPGAKGLPHAPADLNHHFHMKPGDGDGYLFWRVSEGGTVEPFKSMQSTMPAFKTILSEDERWDVLAYVHATFHRGFKSETTPASVIGEGKVIAVLPNSSQIVIDHREIKGFMDAMTMGYTVDPPSQLNGLNAGDYIRFTIDTQQNAIVKIEGIKPSWQ